MAFKCFEELKRLDGIFFVEVTDDNFLLSLHQKVLDHLAYYLVKFLVPLLENPHETLTELLGLQLGRVKEILSIVGVMHSIKIKNFSEHVAAVNTAVVIPRRKGLKVRS